MKPLNNKARQAHKLQFIGMYVLSIILIVIILSAFLQPASVIKTVIVEKEKPALVIIKPVYIAPKNANQSNLQENDSLTSVIDSYERKLAESDAHIQSQKKIIAALRNQSQAEKTNEPVVTSHSNNAEVDKLNKQIEFLDWALRSQVAVTNTLTKENNSLKTKILEINNK